MTDEFFRNDAYVQETDATIVDVTDEGIVLDRTVFYPEGGGQPGDRGRLTVGVDTFIEIVDTRKTASGTLVHITQGDAIPPAVGEHVTAVIDWEYRYRHMHAHVLAFAVRVDPARRNRRLHQPGQRQTRFRYDGHAR